MTGALDKAGIAGDVGRGDRHHQPARDHGRLGPRERNADPQRHRLAGPRGAPMCEQLVAAGHGPMVQPNAPACSSIPISPATKIAWLLDNVPGARAIAAKRGELAFGTIDCFLLWRLTGGKVHATDATNASRTMLFNIHDADAGTRSCSALRRAGVAAAGGEDSAGGSSGADRRERCSARRLPITGIAGDQQAALVGQACFEPGMIKSTYGTGCFVAAQHRRRGGDARRTGWSPRVAYRLEGQAELCDRGQHLRRRRRGAVAARRARS